MRYFPSLLRQTGLINSRRVTTSARRAAPSTRALEVEEVRSVAPPPPTAGLDRPAAATTAEHAAAPIAARDLRVQPAPLTAAPAPLTKGAEPPRPIQEQSVGPGKPAEIRITPRTPPLPSPPPERPEVRTLSTMAALDASIRSPEAAEAIMPHHEIHETETQPHPIAAPEPRMKPVYFAEVREWVAAPLRNQPEPGEVRVMKGPPARPPQIFERTVRETSETSPSRQASAPQTENLSLSIGSIHITVEEPATKTAEPARIAAPAAPAGAGESPFDATRLSRQYVTF